MKNPLLLQSTPPNFSGVLPMHVQPALEEIIQANRTQIARLLNISTPDWNNTVQAVEDLGEALNNVWSIVEHLNNVMSTDSIRHVYEACLPIITEYSATLLQDNKLFQAYEAVKQSDDFENLTQAQKKVVTDTLRDFRLAGIDLKPQAKKRYREIQQQLAKLCNKFEENIIDATDNWSRLIIGPEDLAGIPEYAQALAAKNARVNNKKGWLFTLEFPSYYAIITYADNPYLRKEFYTAYATRASDLGPHAGKYDNSQVMVEILQYRHELAKLLGFNNYAELSLVKKMAQSAEQVLDFLNQLVGRARPKALKEWQALCQFVDDHYHIKELEAWDVAYYSEKYRQHKHNISQEALRPYFPEGKVLAGLFAIVNKLYNIAIRKSQQPVDIWHNDVRYYEIYNKENRLIGSFYLDLYARPQKRSGAWMDACRNRHRKGDGHLQLPIAFINCNFSSPTGTEPALFTHDEVLTLFHEFGHGLHHILTTIECASVSGTNGVAWDAVELPSQFMENWCWQKEGLDLIAEHYQTGETLPEDIFKKLKAAKNFQVAMQMIRQLEFSLFDFLLYLEFNPEAPNRIQTTLTEVRAHVSVVPTPCFNRFQHNFSHIFGGGYAAGYYSYKWAEVLACDAFSKFLDTGIFNTETSAAFLHTILEKGGSEDAMKLFVDFMGREPKVEALLKESGMV